MSDGLTPEEYLRIEAAELAVIAEARARIAAARERAKSAPLPQALRPARPEDIVVGQVLWYKRFGLSPHHWTVVREVLAPHDPWKGYVDDTGSRAGYDLAYVELRGLDTFVFEP